MAERVCNAGQEREDTPHQHEVARHLHDGSILERTRIDRTPDDAEWILARMTQHGSLEHAREIAHGLAGAASHEFSLVFNDLPDTRDKRFVRGVVRWVLERS